MKNLICAVWVASVLIAPNIFGQTADGNIVGSVVDTTGGSIENADVELVNAATGIKSTTKTDDMGGYRFGNVLVGTYNITVAARGFTTASLRNVAVELNKTTTANVSMGVGSVATEIVVTEAAALLRHHHGADHQYL